MKRASIDKLIINSPYSEPFHYWSYDRESRLFEMREGRRPAGYVRASESSKSFDDPGEFIELPLVNQIRSRVKAWREAGYPGVTGITKRLLQHWNDPEERGDRRLFFCQLEAIETLVWLTEAPASEKQGIDVPGDGGEFERLCSKMATGSGKTIVMAMLIAWQVINKATYPQDKRFSKNVFIVAPGLTVKSRLQVLVPSGRDNYYDEFNLIPSGLYDKLRQGKVKIHNWHTLMPLDPNAGPKVVKKGPESNEAFVRRVLGEMANAQNLLVINDEAHHAWRVPPESKVKGVKKEELEEATKWVGGLDRIHQARGILACYDLTATPFAPTGKKSGEETLFGWIVSDFGLNDAIESGLVKTPRVVIRDDALPDAKTYKSKFYHLYQDPEVKDDLNRKALETEPLPDLVNNAYYLLGTDWLETEREWKKVNHPVPPVMITVANRTETAARINHTFSTGGIDIEELCQPERILHIDSMVLKKAEEKEEALSFNGGDQEDDEDAPVKKLTKQQQAELLRRMVDTVGQKGQPGEQIQKVISVGMLSEGWDAKTVTHIMGLRAFTSQLLCEQVVGRGLRRTSYEVSEETGLFEPEYVNIFGVPFTFLPHESTGDSPPPPPNPKTRIEPVLEKQEFEIVWPNVVRVDHVFRPTLTLNLEEVDRLELDSTNLATRTDLAAVLEGKPDFNNLSEIDLQDLARDFRLQKIAFKTAKDVFNSMKPEWKGNREYLIAQLIALVEKFIRSDRIRVSPAFYDRDELRKRIVITLNMTRIFQHFWEAIRFKNTETLVPVLDRENPIHSTGGMRPWYTGKPCEYTEKSHINFAVLDSTWEASEAFELDRNPNVKAWAKNDHLGFQVGYVFNGILHNYRPDFLIRLTNGKTLILEVKGQDTQKDRTKRKFLAEWVEAVNQRGGFGKWDCAVSKDPRDIEGILAGD